MKKEPLLQVSKRILLKLSGESLMGEKQYGIDEKRLGASIDRPFLPIRRTEKAI